MYFLLYPVISRTIFLSKQMLYPLGNPFLCVYWTFLNVYNWCSISTTFQSTFKSKNIKNCSKDLMMSIIFCLPSKNHLMLLTNVKHEMNFFKKYAAVLIFVSLQLIKYSSSIPISGYRKYLIRMDFQQTSYGFISNISSCLFLYCKFYIFL